jgi:hypothetical protein
MEGTEDLGLRNMVIDGVNGYDLVQQKAHIRMRDENNIADEDWGQNMIVDGHRVHYAQKTKPMTFAQSKYYNPNLEIYDDGFPWRETRF